MCLRKKLNGCIVAIRNCDLGIVNLPKYDLANCIFIDNLCSFVLSYVFCLQLHVYTLSEITGGYPNNDFRNKEK